MYGKRHYLDQIGNHQLERILVQSQEKKKHLNFIDHWILLFMEEISLIWQNRHRDQNL